MRANDAETSTEIRSMIDEVLGSDDRFDHRSNEDSDLDWDSATPVPAPESVLPAFDDPDSGTADSRLTLIEAPESGFGDLTHGDLDLGHVEQGHRDVSHDSRLVSRDYSRRIQDVAQPGIELRTEAAEAGRQRLFDLHSIAVSRDDPLYSEAVFLGAAVEVMVKEIQDKLEGSFLAADNTLARAEDATAAATALASKAVHNVSTEAAENARDEIADAAQSLTAARDEMVTTANQVFAGLRRVDEHMQRCRQEHVESLNVAALEALHEYLETLKQISSTAAHEAIKAALEQRVSESVGHRVAESIKDFYTGMIGSRFASAGFWITASVAIGAVTWVLR